MWLLGVSRRRICYANTAVVVRQLVHFGHSHRPDQPAEGWSLWGSLNCRAGITRLQRIAFLDLALWRFNLRLSTLAQPCLKYVWTLA
jgi:hypothetical protein